MIALRKAGGRDPVTPFESKEQFIAIFTALWDRIVHTPAIADPLCRTGLLARFKFSDLETDLYVDARGDRLTFYWDSVGSSSRSTAVEQELDPTEVEPRPDVEMILSSETGHRFWIQDLNIPLALASRKIIAKGSVQKALKLLPALKPAFAVYPSILREMGKGDLLANDEKAAKKRRFKLFRGRRKTGYDIKQVPRVPIEFTREVGAVSPKPAPEFARAAVTDGTIGCTARGAGFGETAPTVPRVSDADLLRMMYRIRLFEQHLSEAFKKGEIPTEAIHLSIGQEAIAAAVCMNLRDSDYLNTTHRGHGHILAKGADMSKVMAEIYGKSDGLCRGKGGSMHVTDRERSILGANGIVGAGYLLAMGAGFAIQHARRDDISVVIAGDGSVNQGMFHEAANMISLLRLPVLIVIENNLYGEFTPVERHSAVPMIFKRAEAYGLESRRLDGNNVQSLYEEVRETVRQMRNDGAPRLIECMTYRWHGHMEGEPELYRSQEEKERYMLEDPILRLENEIVQASPERKEKIEQVRNEAEQEVRSAVKFARDSAPPELSTLTTDVYTPDDESLFAGRGGFPKLVKECGTAALGCVIHPARTGFFSRYTAEGGCATLPSLETGPAPPREISVAAAINEAIAEEMARDEKVFLWGEDVTLGGYFNITEGLVARFGKNRIIDTPISENAIVGGAVGAAMAGMRPIVEILFSDFLTCCMDPILNQAAKLRYMTGGQASIPLTIRTPEGSGIGMAAQHSQSMERFFCGIPGLIVVAPSDAYTAKGLLKSAIRSNNPVLFFEHKLLYATIGKVPDSDYTLPLGKARIVREGDDVTIVSHLLGVSISLDAARLLEKSGIHAEVIDLLTLYPMDTETILRSIAKTRHLMTVEEGVGTGGIGSEVIARTAIAAHGLLKAAPVRIAAPECPIPYARNIENAMLPNPENIAVRIERMLA
jgi:2-oxoisovalerate dehydrogenase E1 component